MKGLIIVGTLKDGGVQKVMFDYVSRICNDIEFEFVAYDSSPGIYGEKLKALNIPIHIVPPISKGFINHKKKLKEIYKKGHYDFVHDNGGYTSYFNLKYAKKCGIKTRIAHSHICHVPENLFHFFQRKIFTFLTKKVATNLYGCSNESCRWTWGENAYKSGKTYVQNNAIEVNKYLFNREKRDVLRKHFDVEDKYVIGHIGRFTFQKNHEFLIRLFFEYHKTINPKAVLMLLGTGALETPIKQLVKELGLNDFVLFLGMRKDANDLLNMMDLFVLPSRYEGFAIVLYEASVNGLPCITNADIGAEEANVLGSINYLKKNDFSEWLRKMKNCDKRISCVDKNRIVEAGFDIDANALRLKKKYLEIVAQNNGK